MRVPIIAGYPLLSIVKKIIAKGKKKKRVQRVALNVLHDSVHEENHK